MNYPVPDDPRIEALGDDPPIVECPDCDGSGLVDTKLVAEFVVEMEDCPRCHGRGEIPNPDLPESEQEAIRQAKGW